MTSPRADPLVSVIVPCFNSGATIERALRSVLAQTSPDFELLVVNDASTDGSPEIARSVGAESGEGRLRVIDLPANQGSSAARNAGLDAARGTYIAFLDADDEMLPTFLEVMTGEMAEGVDLVACGHVLVTAEHPDRVRASRLQGTVPGPEAARAAMTDRLTPFPWDKLYRRELFDGLRYPVGSKRFEDMTMNIALYPRCRAVRSIGTPLHRYYVSGGSLTWGRIPSPEDTSLALALLDTHLDRKFTTGAFAPAYQSMLTLMTLLVAQSALLKLTVSPAARQTVDACRRSLSLRQLALCFRARPALAVGAGAFRLLPGLFAAYYRRYSKRSYGMQPAVSE
jgi:hypothetical protein